MRISFESGEQDWRGERGAGRREKWAKAAKEQREHCEELGRKKRGPKSWQKERGAKRGVQRRVGRRAKKIVGKFAGVIEEKASSDSTLQISWLIRHRVVGLTDPTTC